MRISDSTERKRPEGRLRPGAYLLAKTMDGRIVQDTGILIWINEVFMRIQKSARTGLVSSMADYTVAISDRCTLQMKPANPCMSGETQFAGLTARVS